MPVIYFLIPGIFFLILGIVKGLAMMNTNEIVVDTKKK